MLVIWKNLIQACLCLPVCVSVYGGHAECITLMLALLKLRKLYYCIGLWSALRVFSLIPQNFNQH